MPAPDNDLPPSPTGEPASPQPPVAPGIGSRFALLFLLAGLVAVGYGHTISLFFLSDDFNYLNIVLPAETLAQGTGIADGWVFFRPVTGLSFWWNAAWFGKDPMPYHLTGLIFHVCNAWLVARLAWQVVPHRLSALAAGSIFAVFPPHAEALTWISARADVLCATGVLLAISGWIDCTRGNRGRWALAETCLGLAFALVTKDSAMVLPFLLLFVAWAFPRCGDGGPARGRLGPGILWIFGLFAVYMAARFYVLGGFGGHPDAEGSKHVRIDLPVAIRCTLDAVRFMLVPGTSTLAPWISLTLVVALVAAALRLGHAGRAVRRSWPLLVLFLGLLAPVANMVAFNLDNAQETRFLYMPSLFACTAMGAWVGVLAPSRAARLAQGLLLGLVLTNVAGVHLENRRWVQASAEAEEILEQLRDVYRPGVHKVLVFHALPDNLDGAYLFRNGFDAAVKWFVGAELQFPAHGHIDAADWEKFAAQRRARPGEHVDVLLVRWDRERQKIVLP